MATLVAADAAPPLPAWADELRRRYLRGESSQFVLHGNVHDLFLYDQKLYTLSEFLAQVLLDRSKDTIALYNVSTGVRFAKRKLKLDGLEELVLQKEPAKVLPLLERALTTEDKLARHPRVRRHHRAGGRHLVLDDRRPRGVGDAAPLVAVARARAVGLGRHPDAGEPVGAAPRRSCRTRAWRRCACPCRRRMSAGRCSASSIPRSATRTSSSWRRSPPGSRRSTSRASSRRPRRTPTISQSDASICVELLSGGKPASKEVNDRADKLAQMTQGMTREAIRKLIAPDGKPPAPSPDARAEIDRLVAARKREIIERECFGLIEFVTPQHGFDVVGGMDEVKNDLLLVAKNIREGKRNRVPMGILFTGPMGTGKTFVAEAFAKECGLTTIKLKNFRSKWVGATEGNLERILSVIQAIGQIIVIIDEGDRAFGGGDGDGDGGTSSRVIGRIKEFMSDTDNRGRVLFILMTNRPDKLDVDIKRAGPPRSQDPVPLSADGRGGHQHPQGAAQEEQSKNGYRFRIGEKPRPNRSSDIRMPISKRSSCWPMTTPATTRSSTRTWRAR